MASDWAFWGSGLRLSPVHPLAPKHSGPREKPCPKDRGQPSFSEAGIA